MGRRFTTRLRADGDGAVRWIGMFGGVEWDWDWVQHDDIQVRGPKVSCDNCIGSNIERAFAAGRQAFKNGSKSNPYKYSRDLSDAFWNGWRWQKERVKPPNNY